MPFGVIEKHAPSGPLGTDLINVRHASVSAARQEYAVVFPEYYFGQIFEAMHQPGTIAYSTHLQLEMLQETTAEMGCNGCTKIVIVNGHGGNTNLTQYFTQTQVDKPKNYLVYAIVGGGSRPAMPPPAAAPSKAGVDGHAGEGELSNVMASRPDLVHPSRRGRVGLGSGSLGSTRGGHDRHLVVRAVSQSLPRRFDRSERRPRRGTDANAQ